MSTSANGDSVAVVDSEPLVVPWAEPRVEVKEALGDIKVPGSHDSPNKLRAALRHWLAEIEQTTANKEAARKEVAAAEEELKNMMAAVDATIPPNATRAE